MAITNGGLRNIRWNKAAGRRWRRAAQTAELKAAQIYDQHGCLDGAVHCGVAGTNSGQHSGQPLGKQAQYAQLPHVQRVKGDHTVQAHGARTQAVYRPKSGGK